jgi:hypothetical protein
MKTSYIIQFILAIMIALIGIFLGSPIFPVGIVRTFGHILFFVGFVWVGIVAYLKNKNKSK